MATDTEKEKDNLTWQQKLDKGLPLNPLEETKADAHFNYHNRLREQKERAEFERLKSRGRVDDEDFGTEDKKGNK